MMIVIQIESRPILRSIYAERRFFSKDENQNQEESEQILSFYSTIIVFQRL